MDNNASIYSTSVTKMYRKGEHIIIFYTIDLINNGVVCVVIRTTFDCSVLAFVIRQNAICQMDISEVQYNQTDLI